MKAVSLRSFRLHCSSLLVLLLSCTSWRRRLQLRRSISASAWYVPRIQSHPPPPGRSGSSWLKRHFFRKNETGPAIAKLGILPQSFEKNNGDEVSDKVEGKDLELESQGDNRKGNRVIRAIRALLGYVRARSVLLVINAVLSMKLEYQVLKRLPPSVLVFLVETCVSTHARPKVLRLVAVELDDRVRSHVYRYTGKESYQFGDLTKATIARYTNKEEYQFGDITKTAIAKFTGKAEDEYQFGDITGTVFSKLAGKETYQFGDISRRILRQQQRKECDTSSLSPSARRSEQAYQKEIKDELNFVQNLRRREREQRRR